MREMYKPIILENIRIDGIAQGFIPNGEEGTILTKLFITSDEDRFNTYTTNLLKIFVNINELDNINKLLVIIDKNNTAFVYKYFPMGMEFRSKKDVKKGQVLFMDDVADISKVYFEDTVFDVPINNGDKLIWFFRRGLKFNLYFNLTRLATKEFYQNELGYFYRKTLFEELYKFVNIEKHFNDLLSDGWFPSIRIIGSNFNKLIKFYESDKKYNESITAIISSFSQDEVEQLTNYWWNNPYFKEKQKILQAGIDAYFQNNDDGYITSIKTLSSEVEGILRSAMYIEKNESNPKTTELIDFIIQKASKKYSNFESLGFPQKFKDYLNRILVRGSKISDTKIKTNRNTVAHGIARIENYDQVHALQLILLLDQISFFF